MVAAAGYGEEPISGRRFILPLKHMRFGGLQILLTWVLAGKHYWTQVPAPSAKSARFRKRPVHCHQPRGVPGLLPLGETCAPAPLARKAAASRPHSKCGA